MKPGKTKDEKVIFRKYPDGDIIALFPEIAAKNDRGYTCQSYMRVGQHGAADPLTVVPQTKIANQEEYQPLFDELTNMVGYDLKVIKRFRYSHLEERQRQIKEWSS